MLWFENIRFETPGYLWLLLSLPLVVWWSRKSMAGLGTTRQSIAIVLRCWVLALCVFALAGLQRVKTNDDLTVLFLVDRSDSVPRDIHDQAYKFITESTATMRKDDAVAVLGFDGRAAIEQLPNSSIMIPHLADPLKPTQTDMAGAVRLGKALLTNESINRLVLLTDGNENIGAVLDEVERLAETGTPVDVLPISYSYPNEVLVEQLRAPTRADPDETINLNAVLRLQGRESASGTIKLYSNDRLIRERRVTLDPGLNRVPFKQHLEQVGSHRFRVQFEPDDINTDSIGSNNSGAAFTVVQGEGIVLILHTPRNQGSAALFEAALRSEEIICERRVIGTEELTSGRLVGISCVVLDNVPANVFSLAEQEALTSYVRDSGGGLVMLGGDESFAAGGWMGSPVEEVMPVEFDVKSKRQIPKGALVLVMHACEIPQGNYIGERIAVAAVKTLSSRDLIGVLAWDWSGKDENNWTVPLQPVGNKGRIIQQIKTMSMGDLPDLTPMIKQGVDALLDRKDAAAKHMVVISDFDPMFQMGTGQEGATILKQMRDGGISMSTVSVGWGGHFIDTSKARQMSKGAAEGGQYYEPRDFSKLPQIFIKEARTVHRNMFNEVPFTPRVLDTESTFAPWLSNITIPELGGHVVTTKKPLAIVPLVRDTDEGADPILAHGQFGLGKSVAFTSGMWDRWGADWAQWEQFSGTWAQIVRWASQQTEAAGFDVTTSVQGNKVKVRIDALGENSQARNFMQMNASLLAPDGGDPRPVIIEPVGPGRYEGEFDADVSGSYVLSVSYMGEDGQRKILPTGVSIPYSPEYRELRANDALLSAIKDQANGRILNWDNTSAASVFDRSGLQLAESRRGIWEELLRWMLVFFLLDVAVRRIALDPARMRRFVAEMAGRPQVGEESAATLSGLKGARNRPSTQPTSQAGPAPSRSARYEAPKTAKQSSEELTQALGGASEQNAPVIAKPTRKQTPTDEGSYTSRLLAAKKRARQQQDGEKQ